MERLGCGFRKGENRIIIFDGFLIRANIPFKDNMELFTDPAIELPKHVLAVPIHICVLIDTDSIDDLEKMLYSNTEIILCNNSKIIKSWQLEELPTCNVSLPVFFENIPQPIILQKGIPYMLKVIPNKTLCFSKDVKVKFSIDCWYVLKEPD